MYHIETFEGGTASRAKYLEQEGINFNKIHKNCFIVIKTLSPDSLALNIQNKNLPDMFSFGCGVGNILAGFLSSLDKNSSIRSDLLPYCYFNDKILSYPYILSGYALITHSTLSKQNNIESNLSSSIQNKKKIYGLVSSNGYTNALKTLEQNSIPIKRDNLVMLETQYEAYENFINKKSVSLLGSARDIARCKNRERNGKLDPLYYTYLGGFSDLVQYVGVVDGKDETKLMYSKLFASYLLSPSSQKNLSNYGLFSINGQKIYENGDFMSDFEDILLSPLTSSSAYISQKNVEENRKTTFNKVCLT